jgi:hypothetical protein
MLLRNKCRFWRFSWILKINEWLLRQFQSLFFAVTLDIQVTVLPRDADTVYFNGGEKGFVDNIGHWHGSIFRSIENSGKCSLEKDK